MSELEDMNRLRKVECRLRDFADKAMNHCDQLLQLWRDRGRISWIHCPKCRRDLNRDGYSFGAHGMGEYLAYYECSTCGFRSKFDLDPPEPVYLGEWQRP